MTKIKYIESLITIIELTCVPATSSVCVSATRSEKYICVDIDCSYCAFDKARNFDNNFNISGILKRNNT